MTPTKRPLGVVLLFVLSAIACSHGVPPAAAQPARQPLDPLSPAERAAAEKLVRSDQRARELLGETATLVSIEFLAIKGREKDEAVRHADLLFSRPDTEFGARAIVRLTPTPSIVEFTRVDRKSVPMTASDAQEAWKIALADPAYRARLKRDPGTLKPEALRMYTEDPKDPCFSGRCFYLIVREGDYYLSSGSVTVDLTTKRILPERSPK